MSFEKYRDFPDLKKFMELGGEHTEEGEKFLIAHPKLFMDSMEWDFFEWHRRKFGDTESIHKLYE